ncbi:hypothetical protein ARMGADRAFT_224437 [Armillaria gallica]|uniref:Nucleoside phosphorylase domain-containing protein n=1 Tax=Armillaria gallica TaxID=47427 RepID=A0A2H3EDJ5_ARMGA|nr:hypothetical protein ARMGADRAFT_224437 [Armillaria gallica]
MEGPQFSTRAESIMYRQWGWDLINMSVLPEAKLAREAELSYVLIATATDYDAWRPHSDTVTAAEVFKTLKASLGFDRGAEGGDARYLKIVMAGVRHNGRIVSKLGIRSYHDVASSLHCSTSSHWSPRHTFMPKTISKWDFSSRICSNHSGNSQKVMVGIRECGRCRMNLGGHI